MDSPQPLRVPSRRKDGVALIIVLAFVVIITGVVLAFFSRSLATRQVSDASASQAKADLLAQGATDSIVADLQQEILLSSSAAATNLTGTAALAVTSGTAVYLPLTPASMLPQISGTNANYPGVPPNLLKRSAYDYSAGKPMYFYDGYAAALGTTGTIGDFAINVSSTTPSLNGRSVSLARWNSHYLLPLYSSTDSTPSTAAAPANIQGEAGTSSTDGFVAPDWILVPRSGPSPTTWNSNMATSATNATTVIGRYAYAIYHEGGLLDANVAGYPVGSSGTPVTTVSQSAYKPALAYADLTQLPWGNDLNQAQKQQYVDELVAWRNYASALVDGTDIGNPSWVQSPTLNSGSNYFNYVVNNPNTSGFLRVSGSSLNNGQGQPTTSGGQSDHMFGSRQELIGFIKNGLGLSGSSLNVLNYLATFTRGVNQPSAYLDPNRPTIQLAATNGGNSVVPVSPTKSYEFNDSLGHADPINPPFLTVRATGAFTRNDGSLAVLGEPLVKKRFALSKIAWITYLGPSANRNLAPTSSTGQDADIWALENTYGIPASYLALGTTNNIQEYFGLQWNKDTYNAPSARSGLPSSPGFHDGEFKWFYMGHNTGGLLNQPGYGTAALSNTAGSISRLDAIASLGSNARDPDFFELLKAAIADGSKAKSCFNQGSFGTSQPPLSPYAYQYGRDISLDYAILQLGANIIDQFKVDGYSTRIVFDDNVNPEREFRGVENLPYLYRVNSATLKLRMETPQFDNTANKNAEEDESQAGTFKDTGVGLIMDIPTIWNPHDENAPLGFPGPAGAGGGGASNFRLIADSTDPDDLAATTALATTLATSPETNYYTGFYGSGSQNQTYSNTVAANWVTLSESLYTTGPNGSGSPIIPYISLKLPATAKPMPLCPTNSMLTFSVPNVSLFREPTVLAIPNRPKGSNLQMPNPPTQFPQYSAILNQAGKPAYSTTANNLGFLSDSPNPLNLTPSSVSGTTPYIGICCALFPIEFPSPPATSGTGISHSVNVTLNQNNGDSGNDNITYRLQYQDPNPNDPPNSWETYDEKYNFIDCLFLSAPFETTSGNLADQCDGAQGGDWESYADPRTSRFGAVHGVDLENPVQTPAGSVVKGAGESQEWTDANNDIEVSDRPDENSGYAITDARFQTDGELVQYVSSGFNIGPTHLRIGLLSQNNTQAPDNGIRFTGDAYSAADAPVTSIYYSDPDGVVRGAMGNYVTSNSALPATTDIGLPEASAYNATSYGISAKVGAPPPNISGTYQGQSRPYILHRPFRSVSELGYVFSGTPWKNIDFFTPQSGDASLLDVFSATETPNNSNQLVAGVVNLNTRQEPVLQAILTGASIDEAQTSGTASTGFTPFTSEQVQQILATSGTGISYFTRTSSANTQPGYGPLQNLSDLVGRYYQPLAALSGTQKGFSGVSADLGPLYASAGFPSNQALQMQNIDRFREAFIRPLTAVGNTRVWNLLIDVIAQTGRYPAGTSGAGAAANFVVDGEQRYWVHVAIDRYTGQVLDKQVEVVKQ